MEPSIRVLTLAVDNLERSLAFYRDGLGLATKGITGQQFENGAVVFFQLSHHLILALWPATSFEKDAMLTITRDRTGAVSIARGPGVSLCTPVGALGNSERRRSLD